MVGRKSIITPQLVEKVNKLREKGITIKKISESTKVSRSTVYKILKVYLNYQSNFQLKKPKNKNHELSIKENVIDQI